jgi:polysaccharide deacetylase family protein (PEP-CTERM system associated)
MESGRVAVAQPTSTHSSPSPYHAAPGSDASSQAASAAPPGPPRRHLLTVGLEDYYDVGSFGAVIERSTWARLERRLEIGTRRALALLDQYDAHATFFVLGWVADAAPELVREIADHGHEVASRGYHHRPIARFSPAALREDLDRTREALTRATGRPVHGHRVADWLDGEDLWPLDVIADAGFRYDSSLRPLFRRCASAPWRRFAHHYQHDGRELWEFPLSAVSLSGWCIPVAGGNYFRQLPHPLIARAVAHWDRTVAAPFVMYFHTWELDEEQPRITAAPLHARTRHYRHLERMPAILRHYLSRYRFTSVADHLGLDTAPRAVSDPAPAPPHVVAPPRAAHPAARAAHREPVTIVVPCYNEEATIPLLLNALGQVEEELSDRWDVRLLFVDDGSRDATANVLAAACATRPGARLVRHAVNRGIAASIGTGIRHADTEIVCSMDCDCSYDPLELGRMLPLLDRDVAVVTGSPYHPRGRVRNVPAWRLGLSRSLSRLYRAVLGQPLYTYTSCFRVYRRSLVVAVPVRHGGFLGIAELLGKVLLGGERVVEHPTTLAVRVLGCSKLRTTRTILGHLRLLTTLAHLRLLPASTRRARLGAAPSAGRAPSAAL